MASNQNDFDAFLDACWDGSLQKTQEALASRHFTIKELEEGLTLATRKAHSDIVAMLFDAGAPVSSSTVGALSSMVQHPKIVQQFFKHGMDPNARLSNGEPLIRYQMDPACAREFLLRGSDPNLLGPSGISALFCAIQSSKEENTSLLQLLIEYGAKLEPELLFTAVAPRRRYKEVMTKFLLDKGLDPNTTNTDWGTPLHLAVYSAKPNIVKLLLDAGTDPTPRGTGKKFPGLSPLQLAQRREQDDPELTKIIVDLLQRRP